MRDHELQQMRHDITPGSSIVTLKALFSFAKQMILFTVMILIKGLPLDILQELVGKL